jgi:hypothetical protein
MAPKRPSRSRTVSARLHRASVPKRKPASAKAYTACRSLQSARAAIDFLGLSYSEFGAEYSRLLGSARSLSRQAVYKMLNAPRLTDNAQQVLGQLLSNHLTHLCGEEIGITIVQNSPMHVTAYRHCDNCRSLYALDRPDLRRCPRCRK